MSSFRRQLKKSLTFDRSKKVSNSTKDVEDTKENKYFIHGCIQIEIKSARNLPDMDSWISKLMNKNAKYIFVGESITYQIR